MTNTRTSAPREPRRPPHIELFIIFYSHLDSARCALLLFFTFYFLPISVAQNTIQSKVIESETNAPIPYASVYTLKDRHGTITDLDGKFELTDISENDTIVFYFAGFQKKRIPAKEIGQEVRLKPLEQLLDDVIVLADESIPYKLISNTRKTIKHKDETAQSYLEMQSFQDNQQLEYFQGYYNGTYDGYDIEDLELKTARFGVQRTQNLAFLSQETSIAMYKQEIFEENQYFPDSPFGLKRRKLVRKFRVQMNAKYLEQNGDITYVLSFEPRKDSTIAFSGKAWIDSATNVLTKVQFTIENARRFPFTPIHSGGELREVNMHITKSYERTEKGVRLNSMDFDYDFIFNPNSFYDVDHNWVYKERPTDSSVNYRPIPKFHVRAEAVLAAYNFEDEFSIPTFNFPSHDFPDYRKMIAFQDHINFWDCYTTFRVGKSEAKESFLNDPKTVTHTGLFKKSLIFKVGVYEYPYRNWSTKRVYFRPRTDSTKVPDFNSAFEGNSINAREYALVAQILFEVDSLCGFLQYRTRTIFDPFQSFYNFERTPRSVAFLNVYFDLMELSRRELVEKLEAVENPTEEIWIALYEDHLEETNMRMATFFKEVERGTNEENFLKWNAIVVEGMRIDNNTMFSAPKTEENE